MEKGVPYYKINDMIAIKSLLDAPPFAEYSHNSEKVKKLKLLKDKDLTVANAIAIFDSQQKG